MIRISYRPADPPPEHAAPAFRARPPHVVTLSVWRALLLREALDRLFDMRAAWLWLLLEPVMHIAFITFVYTVIRVRVVGGIDSAMWVITGMLAFFMFRRTAVQVAYAVESNQPLFAYRQVRPFDVAFARAVLEAFLMIVVSVLILAGTALLGRPVMPSDPLLVAAVVCGLWLYGLGYGLVASVLKVLLPESEHLLRVLMLPLYLVSGTISPISAVPAAYQNLLLLNPIAHGLELVRYGFGTEYHVVTGVSLAYLYAWAGASVFLGLVLYRRYARQLAAQ